MTSNASAPARLPIIISLVALATLILLSISRIPATSLEAPNIPIESALTTESTLAPAANPTTLSPSLNSTQLKQLQAEIAYAKIRSAKTPLPKGVFALTRPCGQTCNNYLSLALGLTEARKRNSRFLLWGRWKEVILQFDIDRLVQMVGDDLLLDDDDDDKSHSRVHKESCSARVWCGSRLSLDMIRDVLRPPVKDQQRGLESIARLRAMGATKLVSVHGRHIRGDCTTLGQRLGYFCHEHSTLDAKVEERFVNHYCHYGLTPALVGQAVTTWPQLAHERLGFFLSTDAFQTHLDATYENKSGWPAGVHATYWPRDTSMPADMWTSVFADFYMSTPVSSCEGIIAQWRLVLNNASSSGMWPVPCYETYAQPQRSQGFCDHTNVVILDEPPKWMSTCDLILALSSAIVKARQGGILLWGPWRTLVDAHLNLTHLRQAYPYVEFSMNRVMRTHSKYWSRADNWYSIRLNSTQEFLCARGKNLRPLRVAIRPGAAAAAAEGQRIAPPTTTATCSRFSVVPTWPAPSAMAPSSLESLWASAMRDDFRASDVCGSCAQVAAVWRAFYGKPTEPSECFGGFLREEDESVCQ